MGILSLIIVIMKDVMIITLGQAELPILRSYLYGSTLAWQSTFLLASTTLSLQWNFLEIEAECLTVILYLPALTTLGKTWAGNSLSSEIHFPISLALGIEDHLLKINEISKLDSKSFNSYFKNIYQKPF